MKSCCPRRTVGTDCRRRSETPVTPCRPLSTTIRLLPVPTAPLLKRRCGPVCRPRRSRRRGRWTDLQQTGPSLAAGPDMFLGGQKGGGRGAGTRRCWGVAQEWRAAGQLPAVRTHGRPCNQFFQHVYTYVLARLCQGHWPARFWLAQAPPSTVSGAHQLMEMALLSRGAGAMPQSLGWRRALCAAPARGVVAPIRARPQARSQSGGRSSGAPWLDRVFGSKSSVDGGSGGGSGGGVRCAIMAFVQLLGVAATLLTITTQVGRGWTGASWCTALPPAGASAPVLMCAGGTHANWAP